LWKKKFKNVFKAPSSYKGECKMENVEVQFSKVEYSEVECSAVE